MPFFSPLRDRFFNMRFSSILINIENNEVRFPRIFEGPALRNLPSQKTALNCPNDARYRVPGFIRLRGKSSAGDSACCASEGCLVS